MGILYYMYIHMVTVDPAVLVVDPIAEALALAGGCSRRTQHRPPSPAPGGGRG